MPVKANTTDYVSFWAAGRLADQGHAILAYDHAAHLRMEEAATAPGINYEYFFNPPTFLLLMAPLAWLPYFASFVAFQAVTLGLWLVLGTRVAGGGWTATLCLLAVPSLWWVLGLGQNSCLTAALMAGGLLALPRRPWLAGAAFGLLCYKPHLGLLIPVALAAGGEWVAMLAAGLCVSAMLAATVALFGWEIWPAYLHVFSRDLNGPINGGRVLLSARVDPTGAGQELGLGLAASHAIWAACVAGALLCVWRTWRADATGPGQPAAVSPARQALRGAALAAGAILAAPFALFYDLMLCSLAAAWLVRAARHGTWLRGEAAALTTLAVLCLLAAAPIVQATGVPVGALIAPALLGLAWRRGRARPGALPPALEETALR